MDIRNISFCDKTFYNITNDEYKKQIINKLKSYNVNIIDKYIFYNENKHKKELLTKDYIFHYKTKGNNYLLFITKIHNIKYCFFIDKKINKGYIYPRILLVHYRLNNNIYNDTILNGELLLKDNKWFFYIKNIYYYCGFDMSKYNIFDRLNNIKKILNNNYISDENIEPCQLKLIQYYPLKNININNKLDDLTGIEFISYNGKNTIYYSFNHKNKNKVKYIKNNTNYRIFKISKSNYIDIYNLYCLKKEKLYNIGIARIDSNNSNFLYNFFKDKNMNYKKSVKCIYNNQFNKWKPIEFCDNKVDDYFDIKDFLNNNKLKY